MNEEYNLKNYMEEVVEETLSDVIDDLGICTCKQCRLDVMALALNNLPPKYVVTEKGEIYSKLNMLQQQFEVDAIAAIATAADTIKKNPRHVK